MTPDQLANLLVPQYPSSTAAEILADLNSAGNPIQDSKRKMVGDIIAAVGEAAASDLLTAMDTASSLNVFVKNAVLQLNSTGLDLSHPTVQATIAGLPFASEANRTAVAEMGTKSRTKWEEMAPGETLPTEQQISDAQGWWALWDWWQQKFTVISSKIHDGTITDVAGVVAEVQA